MIFFAVAFGLLLHAFFWGTGLAILAVPRPWRRFWPVLVLPAGFALQSAVVWLGAYANLHGTNCYAWPSELIPTLLLVFALRRHDVRKAQVDLSRFGLLWGVVAAAVLLLVLPLAVAARGLTTTSLGSCDAADYAAGARVFMEFSHSDRSGFLGLTEVVRVLSTDNFFDYWLRLNHFTPSALMALNGSVLHCAPHETAGLITILALVATIPVVFWIARAVFGYSGAASLIIAAVFGLSPVPWYSAAHVSPAPLLASQAIGLLNWAGISLWNGRLTWRRGLQFAGVLAIGYVIVLGSYNFILLVCLVPAVAFAGARAIMTDAWTRLLQWLAIMLGPLAACGLFFWARVAGLVERFTLFQTYDFGWRIPGLTPEGWLGMVQGGSLQPWAWMGLRWILALVLVFVLVWALARAIRSRRRRVWIIASVTVPVLMGYGFLEGRGIIARTNASYDAFKLFTVFYPLLLPAFCWWITLRWSSRLTEWFGVAGLAAVVVAFNLVGCGMFIFRMCRPPLTVDGELRQLRKVETMADVDSVNLLIPDMWSRLWANEFILRKPQYFLTHTYEGRLNTTLKGEWDLISGVVRVEEDGASRRLSENYWLTDTRAPEFIRATRAEGWFPEERLPDGVRWDWTRRTATLRVENPHPYPVQVAIALDGRCVEENDVSIGLAGAPAGWVHVGKDRRQLAFPAVRVPPGQSTVEIRVKNATVVMTDDRQLALCVFSLVLRPARP